MNWVPAWFMFRTFEVATGLAIVCLHLFGAYQVESITHTTFYCGTFAGWTLYSSYCMMSIFWRSEAPCLFMEVISCFAASIMHVLVSYLTMGAVEKDDHLWYISNDGEAEHKFFIVSVQQSYCSMGLGLLYLLHGLYAGDALWVGSISDDEDDFDLFTDEPIQLFVFGKWVHTQMERYKWFCRMGGECNEQEEKPDPTAIAPPEPTEVVVPPSGLYLYQRYKK